MKIITRFFPIIFFLSAIIFISLSCSKQNTNVKPNCIEEFETNIHSKTFELYPYKEELKSIIFSDSTDNNYIFNVQEFNHSFSDVRAICASFTSEYFCHNLYCQELDLYLTLTLMSYPGPAVSNMEANSLQFSSFDSDNIQDLILIDAKYSRESDCLFFHLDSDIVIERENEEKLKELIPHKKSFSIHNKDFDNIYKIEGKFDKRFNFYFNFDFGLVTIRDSINNLTLKYEGKT